MPDPYTARRADRLLGRLAVERMLITQDELQAALRRKEEIKSRGINKRLGTILIEDGLLTTEDVKDLLAYQETAILECPGCGVRFNVEGFEPGKRFICRRCKTVLQVPPAGSGVEVDETIQAAARTPATPAGVESPTPARVSGMQGRQIGGCRIERLIGRGGMGAVYEAVQLSLERQVALKILPENVSEDEIYTARFEREARSIAALNHPNIVQVYDMGKDEASGLYYIVMEYVEGGSLAGNVKVPLGEKDALRYAAQAAEGLGAAHGQGIIHRDIKPDNLLLDRYDRVKIVDFGLARGLDASVQLTGSGSTLGTPAYMSPEQGMGHEVDTRTDIYSLGATLYTILAGAYPYKAESPISMVVAHANQPEPKIRKKASHVSRKTEDLIVRAMAKKPARRFPDGKAFAEAARAILSGLEAEKGGGKGPVGERKRERRKPPSKRTPARPPETAYESRRRTAARKKPSSRREATRKTNPALIAGLGAGTLLILLILLLVVASAGKGRGSKGKEEPGSSSEDAAPAEVERAPGKGDAPSPPAEVPEDRKTDAEILAILRGGAVTTDLTVPAGEYELVSDVEVIEGVTLTVEAGAIFLFGKHAGLYCRGRLVAKGAAGEKILFQPLKQGEGWLNVTLDGFGSKGSVIEHAVIEGGRGRKYPAIDFSMLRSLVEIATIEKNPCGGCLAVVNGSGVTMEGVEIRHGRAEMSGGGILVHKGEVLGRDCRIEYNKSGHPGGGVAQSAGFAKFTGCIFSRNESTGESSNSGAIYASSGAQVALHGCEFCMNSAGSTAGAVRVHGNAKLTAEDTAFSKNTSQGSGALKVEDASADLSRCTFLENISTGESGGAVFFNASRVRLADCVFKDNTAVQAGGSACFLDCRDVSLQGCSFTNSSSSKGGALYFEDASGSLSDCRFEENRGSSGGAVYVLRGDRLVLEACVFSDNSTVGKGSGGGMYIRMLKGLEIAGTDFTNSRAGGDGGGVCFSYLDRGSCKVDVSRCFFEENRSNRLGGGMALGFKESEAEVRFEETEFFGNSSKEGGGALVLCINQGGHRPADLRFVMEGGGFEGNESLDKGGAFVFEGRSREKVGNVTRVELRNVRLLDNRAASWGGGAHVNGVSKGYLLKNVSIAGNRGKGGGLFVMNAMGGIENCAIRENESLLPEPGGGGILWQSTRPRIDRASTVASNRPDDIAEYLGAGMSREDRGERDPGPKPDPGPEPAPARTSTYRKFLENLEKVFYVPGGGKDRYGNPVVCRNGESNDPETGLPYEIWMQKPRMEFVLVKDGRFTMGTPADAKLVGQWERPAHPVSITRPLYLGKYEITQGQWKDVMGDNPSKFPQAGDGSPVNRVSWEDVKGFLAKVNESMDEGVRRLGVRFRLPSEAEWEYACRAGTTTDTYAGDLTIRKVFDSPELDKIAWYGGNCEVSYRPAGAMKHFHGKQYEFEYGGPHTVGGKSPNAWGFYDMIGNVWEWCEDVWDTDFYGKEKATRPDPIRGEGGTCRVIRGCSWINNAASCRSANRWGMEQEGASHDAVGFRAALTLR